ncbi:MAG: SurA N-terminal domain-containing protein [Bacteroidota bacterium]|nr:SurA N-terminal domain-containing protein [Bacteroidota bacterium]
MAIISKIREKSSLVLILIGVAMVAFIATDLFTKNSFLGGDNGPQGVATINGRNIQENEYNAVKDKVEQQERQQMQPDEEMTPEKEISINDRAWQLLTLNQILSNESEKLGLNVTDQEIMELCFGQITHPAAGQMLGGQDQQLDLDERKQIFNAIKNIEKLPVEQQQAWASFEEDFSTRRLYEKYNAMASKSYFVTDLEAAADFSDKNNIANIEFVPLLLTSISDSSVTVTDADIKRYYDDHKEQFRRDNDGRSFDYVIFPVTIGSADTLFAYNEMLKKAENWKTTKNDSNYAYSLGGKYTKGIINKGQLPKEIDSLLFTLDSGQVSDPVLIGNKLVIAKASKTSYADSLFGRKVSHIVIRPVGVTMQDSAKAKFTIDSIASAVKKGADFAAIAKVKGQDGSAQQGGDLGWVNKQSPMDKDFMNAVYGLNNKGDVVTVKSQFGYHVITMTQPVSKKAVMGGFIEKEIRPTADNIQAVSNRAQEFQKIGGTAEEFENSIKKQSLQPRIADNVQPGNYTIPGLTIAREVVKWAYNTDTKVGDVSNVIKAGDNYVVARLKLKYDAGITPLEDIKQDVKAFAIQEKKKEMLVEKMKNAMPAAANDFNKLANTLNSSVGTGSNITFEQGVIPNIPTEPYLVGFTMGMKEKKVYGPIAGANGVYVVRLTSLNKTPIPKDFSNDRKMLIMQNANNAGNEAIEALKRKADIKDYRYIYN